MALDQLARLLIVGGLVLAGVGVLLLVLGRIPFLGRLPGDFTFSRDNVTIYVPIATSIILSLLLTLLLNFLLRR
jgi:hypothetical protein